MRANQLMQQLRKTSELQVLFWGLALITLLSIWAGVALNFIYLAGLPLLVLAIYWTMMDIRTIYFLLMACIPLSTEVVLPNGFGTDLPDEPLIVGLFLVSIPFLFHNIHRISSKFILHPISLLLLLHFSWILLCTLQSKLLFVSVKYLLAKSWYIVVFYCLTGYFIDRKEQYQRLFWWVFWPLIFTVVVIVSRHALTGFSFAEINFVLRPFYRNHVSYAGLLALFFPLMWFAPIQFPRFSIKWYLFFGAMGLMLLAIYFTYTRAAYIAVVMAAGAYFIIKWRLMRPVLAVAGVALIIGFLYLSYDNNYLDFAPDFNKTISHESFGNLMEATYKMEDISTMERVYRWVAAFQMSLDRPWMGFGPGNFVNFYQSYTVTSFQTYVSDNPEGSGVHCYYLMTLVEQGYIGLILFIALSFLVLIQAEKIYHRCTNPTRQRIIMAVTLCTVVMDAFLLINDMVETDKMGSFFFVCMAVLVNQDLENSKQQ
ncbi:MAG TPA: O-antigen ligase family protein [Haliscomenobacter sp.]|uniref:O-antigen ligase family protein n=1 Tax=Haliscomenobacter sp. TaxID=2717303 RepID=UPI002C9FE83B|nr:O-antigen ligase family protein [Haliscomenobacter sp.]HOY16560.1 O-antigen ligase family protein [Haliscomenobacter sp.]HPH17903.1 O-antigen ligase family protein [Haliscomenobacter sp.]